MFKRIGTNRRYLDTFFVAKGKKPRGSRSCKRYFNLSVFLAEVVNICERVYPGFRITVLMTPIRPSSLS